MGIKYYNRIRNIILIWNIYLTVLIPFVVLLSGIWHLESGVRHGKAAGLPIAVILAFLPLVLFGLKWKMDSTFTIIVSCVWFIFMWKMEYYFFYDKTNSPIVYYSSVIVNITALLWSIIVKEYKPLEEHILKYRQDQWLVPCSENYKENKVLRSIWLVCFIGTVVFSFVCQWRSNNDKNLLAGMFSIPANCVTKRQIRSRRIQRINQTRSRGLI